MNSRHSTKTIHLFEEDVLDVELFENGREEWVMLKTHTGTGYVRVFDEGRVVSSLDTKGHTVITMSISTFEKMVKEGRKLLADREVKNINWGKGS